MHSESKDGILNKRENVDNRLKILEDEQFHEYAPLRKNNLL